MLGLIPPPLHRAGLRLAHAVRLRWWALRKPSFAGCRVLALDGDDRVLLVRHSYGTGKWMPPGGGVKRGEDPLIAASRELFEETGCRLGAPVLVARLEEDLRGAINTVHIVSGQATGNPLPDGRETIAARFFALHELPDHMPEKFRASLVGWITEAKAARRRDVAADPGLQAPTG